MRKSIWRPRDPDFRANLPPPGRMWTRAAPIPAEVPSALFRQRTGFLHLTRDPVWQPGTMIEWPLIVRTDLLQAFESADIAAFDGTVVWANAMIAIEDADVASFDGFIDAVAVLSIQEAEDVATLAGDVT